MSQTLPIILATGAVTVVNSSVFHDKPMDWRVPVATCLAGVGFSLLERPAPQLAVILAWTTLLTVLLTRTTPTIPSPTESAVAWWNKGK